METTPNPSGTPRSAHPLSRKLLVGAAVVGAMLGTAGIAVAQTADSPSSAPTVGSAPDAGRDRTQSVHPGETPLTGETATKVAEAARQAVPDGTVDRVETDAEGAPYEAHVTKADGSRVTVKVADDFSVSGVEAEPAGGPGGHHGPPPTGQAPTGQAPTDQAPAA